MIKCKDCREYRLFTEFHADAGRPHGRSNRCKACDMLRIQAKRHGRKSIVQAAKNKPCHDCGVSYPYYVMDLDHRPGTKKKFQLNRAGDYSSVLIKAEIAKCDVVCANCHRERTYQRLNTTQQDPDISNPNLINLQEREDDEEDSSSAS